MKRNVYRMKKKTNFYFYFVDAKVRRFLADSKKNARFFSKLYGQTPDLWTNRQNLFKTCPKELINDATR